MPPTSPESIAETLSLPVNKVASALALFDEGATVPFVARYRKERTGGLDEVQLREIQEAQRRLTELNQRLQTIREAIRSDGKLTPELDGQLQRCASRAELEELYAPYKKRRKTRADMARERGLEPLAKRIFQQPREGQPRREAQAYVSAAKGVPDVAAALSGARDIIAERLAMDPGLRAHIRGMVERHGRLRSTRDKKATDADRFRDYLDYEDRVDRIPGHRYLAICRGESEGALTVKVRPDMERTLAEVLRGCSYFPNSPFGPEFASAVEDALKRLLLPAAERAVRGAMKERADDEGIQVFGTNLESLLLAAPLGGHGVLGIDPGIRTGCKCAMVDAKGTLSAHTTLYLVGRKDPDREGLLRLLKGHQPRAIAVGNGTGGREAEALARSVVEEAGLEGTLVVSVNEAGASIYSASEIAREELPDVDLTVRGAVSIARRLQDPLAELVKLDPQSIGVGQYQHDVDQGKLGRRLKDVVESCVNRVGVHVNTASPALLGYVAAIGPRLATAIVTHREAKGAFRTREDLKEVAGLGSRTYEQCAGFLRIRGGPRPLDASGVHPERYGLVRQMARDHGVSIGQLLEDEAAVDGLDLSRYVDDQTGMATLRDISDELRRPGRDPRDSFEAVEFREDVREVEDLKAGMDLPGVVTNVTNFGAFVDIGVHQDGLVHISELADRFVSSPHDVVRPGQALTVRVLEVDLKRRRISLSAKQARPDPG